MRVVFRHLPLITIHDKALLAAEAAEAAGAQAKFWEMHNLLFMRQQEWRGLSEAQFRVTLEAYAHDLGLDVAAFTKALEEGTYRAKVQASYDQAVGMGIMATPTYFLNGQYFDGPRTPFIMDALVVLFNHRGPQYDAPGEMNLDPEGTYIATVETTRGTFCIELYPDRAPRLVNSFVFLAGQGFFDGTPFHRVLPGLVVQGGDPTGTGFGGPGYHLADEIDPDLKHDAPGVVSMANTGADTNGSQFFITLDALPAMDGRHSIIGRVVQGMDVVQRMTPRDAPRGSDATPDRIIRITIGSTCDVS